ncbi:MAG: DNA internalization-related competence protein ComEC/Rec2 [Ornithinimicrobium sp.]
MSRPRPEATSSDGSETLQRGQPALDLRLMIPALVAWSVSAGLIGGPTRHLWVAGGVASVALTGALVQVGRGSRSTVHAPSARLAGLLALTALSVILVCGAALGQRSIDRAGPIAELAAQRAVVQITGTVVTQPRLLSRGGHGQDQVVLRMRVDRVSGRGEVSAPSTPVLVFADTSWAEVPWRSQISTGGRLAQPRDEAGNVDLNGDVVAVLSPFGSRVLERAPPRVMRGADVMRDRLRAAMGPLPADARGLIPGLVIGDTSLTPPELTEAMLDTGMSHLSAVSGSNVAIVLGAVVVLCRASGVPRRWRAPLAVLALAGFVVLCRPEPSVLRASVMGVIGLAGLSASRRPSTVPALAGAVLALLCVDPSLARSYGFALSALATLGLVIFARPWGDAISARLPSRAALVGDAVAIPLAAQVVCAPVIVLLQGNIAVVAVLANLLAAPMVAFTTIAGIAAALGATVWLSLGTALGWLGAVPAVWIGLVARWCSQIPWGQVDWVDGGPGAWLLTVITVLLLLIGPWLRHQVGTHPVATVGVLLLSAAVLLPLPGATPWPPPKGWVMVACDVGQGDAFLIATGPDSAIVVDVGQEPEPIADCLGEVGVDRVEAVILSHFHRDHVGGLSGVLDYADVHAAYVTSTQEPQAEAERALELLSQANVRTQVLSQGDELSWGAVRANVVFPEPQRSVYGGSVPNNASLVLDVTSGSTRILLTGDIEEEAAAVVRKAVQGQRFDVLKVAHHGSADQDEELVRGSGASLALIGVGAENTFGHPTPSALTLLRQSGMRVMRTDKDGDIAVLRSGSTLSVVTEHGRRGG